MAISIRELLDLSASRSELFKLTIFTLLFALFEGVGLGLLLPILDYVVQGELAVKFDGVPVISDLLNVLGRQPGHVDLFIFLSLAFLSLLLRSVFHYLQDVTGVRLSLTVSSDLRRRAIDSFLLSDFAFLSTSGASRLYGALTMEAARAGEALKAQIVFITSSALLLVYVLLLCWLSPQLFLLTLPVFALAVLVFHRMRQVLWRLGEEVSKLNNSFSRLTLEHLRGMDRVKMRGQEANAAKMLNQTIEQLASSSLTIERWRLLVDIGMFPALVLSAFGVLYVAVVHLGMKLSSLGLFLFILMRLTPHFTTLNGLWSHIHSCFASFHDLSQLIAKARMHREHWQGKTEFYRLTTGLQLERVSFAYPGADHDMLAIEDISFSIPRGSLTALVGRSGAGKSTLVKLLVGFYRVQCGQILVDGTPLCAFDLTSWRRKLAYLPQEPFLFNETVRYNLNYGLNQPLTELQVSEVLDQSYARAFVNQLENGLETNVGEAGQRLSQGQKQRLALAHALAVEPQLLILDEPTSALDSESEEAIQQTLLHLRGRVTTIVIAHRLSTIRNADQIILLDQGKVAAEGPHDELLQRSALYRSLFNRQMIL